MKQSSDSTSASLRFRFTLTSCESLSSAAYLFLPSFGLELIHFSRLPSQDSKAFLKKTEQSKSSTLEILRPFSLKRRMEAELIFVIQFGPVKARRGPRHSAGAAEVRQLQGQRGRPWERSAAGSVTCESVGVVDNRFKAIYSGLQINTDGSCPLALVSCSLMSLQQKRHVRQMTDLES